MKDRLRAILAKLETPVDALVLANSIDNHVDRSFFYLFDVPSGLFEGSLAIGLPDGRLHVFTSPLEEESARRAAEHDAAVEVHTVAARGERDALLQKLVPAGGRVALNQRELTYESFLSLQKALPAATFVDASEAIRKVRMVKDAGEIERIGKAAELASAVGREIPGMLRTGLTETRLAAEIEYRMMQHGASGASFATIVAFDAKGAEPHYAPQERALASGASIVCDFGALYRRYASDITRSFRFGKRDPELKKVHETVLAAQEAALAKLRPGVPGKEVHAAAAAVIDASPWKGRFIHGLGHSVGLAVHDGYSMNPLVEEPLAEGMVVTVEPGIYLPGKGGVRIEDDVVVTRDGYRFLTTTPREYLEVAA